MAILSLRHWVGPARQPRVWTVGFSAGWGVDAGLSAGWGGVRGAVPPRLPGPWLALLRTGLPQPAPGILPQPSGRRPNFPASMRATSGSCGPWSSLHQSACLFIPVDAMGL